VGHNLEWGKQGHHYTRVKKITGRARAMVDFKMKLKKGKSATKGLKSIPPKKPKRTKPKQLSHDEKRRKS